MATITLNIPADKIQLIIDSFCNTQGYQEEIEGEGGEMIPNPETKAQFSKRMVIKYVKGIVLMEERRLYQLELDKFTSTELNIT